MASGDTKTEAMLNVLGNGGSGDEFRGCCNTKTQQYILDAIDRINNIQPGGSYEAGTGIEIADNTISVDTDTIQPKLTAGTNITIDADNVISASGGGGGGITELTSADYNWPVSDPQGIAYWLLDDGVYYAATGVRFYYGSASSQWNAAERVFIVEADGSSYKTATSLEPHQINYYRNNVSTGDNTSGYPYTVLTTNSVVQSTGTSTSSVMSQKAVTDALASAGGGGVTELTSADYNYPVGTPNKIAFWLLEPGVYVVAENNGLSFAYSSSESGTVSNDTLFVVTRSASGAFSEMLIGESGSWTTYGVQTSNGAAYAAKTGEMMLKSSISQSTGTSTTDVMSQNATTSMVFADAANQAKIRIGNTNTVGTNSLAIGNGSSSNQYCVSVGDYAQSKKNGSTSIGYGAETTGSYGVSLGYGAKSSAPFTFALPYSSATEQGVVQFGLIPAQATSGYNSSIYRLLTGLYDPQNAHDAATKGYVDGLVGNVASALNAINNGTGA